MVLLNKIMRRVSKITIPLSLFKRLKEGFKKKGFKSFSEYATYLLEKGLEEEKEQVSPSEKEELKERLKSLGYIG